MLMMLGLFLHYIHVGDNSQLCNKNNETNLLNQICNFKNAIHILYSFVVCNLLLTLMCLVLFFDCKGSGFSIIYGVNIDFLGYELFRIWVKTIGFATIKVKFTLNDVSFSLLKGYFFCLSFLLRKSEDCLLCTTKKP